ncbi:hypothetical protein [Cellulomonas denverensis]|uniref:Uncharacterized protein n=2 Tax=Cellulomonas denverensis TaxID=264297 RepID=A0A7X6KS06_9CELL|nr:hypothetical protein [Cellulomonas denverensis]NKY21152.1 hypothetical protein [Cellulomonas denverensis]
MSITVVGIVTVAALAAVLLTAPRHLVWLLAASAPFMRTAAVSISGNGVPPFYLVALVASTIAFVTWARGWHTRVTALRILGWFVAWSLLVTAVSPVVFAGVPVLDPRGGIDEQVLDPTPLAFSISVVAQAGYLVLAAGVVLYLAQRRTLSSGLLTPAITLGTVLSAIRLLPGTAFMDGIFRSYGAGEFNLYDTRHYGIFFEPSYLATFSIGALAYCAYRVQVVRGWRRFGIATVGLLAAVNLLYSGTGTGAASVVILVGIAVCFYGFRFLFRGARLHPLAALVPILLAIVLVVPNPVRDSLSGTIGGKLVTDSYTARTASNWMSIDIMWNTWTLGSGLGTSRPSSFAALVVSTTGLLGTVLLAVFLGKVIIGASRRPEWKPVAMGLLGLIVAKVVAEPDLSVPLLWLAVGACAYAMKPSPEDPEESALAVGAAALPVTPRPAGARRNRHHQVGRPRLEHTPAAVRTDRMRDEARSRADLAGTTAR